MKLSPLFLAVILVFIVLYPLVGFVDSTFAGVK